MGRVVQKYPLWINKLHSKYHTLPETDQNPENMPSQKETIVFQPSIFRCENLSFSEDNLQTFPAGFFYVTKLFRSQRKKEHILSRQETASASPPNGSHKPLPPSRSFWGKTKRNRSYMKIPTTHVPDGFFLASLKFVGVFFVFFAMWCFFFFVGFVFFWGGFGVSGFRMDEFEIPWWSWIPIAVCK